MALEISRNSVESVFSGNKRPGHRHLRQAPASTRLARSTVHKLHRTVHMSTGPFSTDTQERVTNDQGEHDDPL